MLTLANGISTGIEQLKVKVIETWSSGTEAERAPRQVEQSPPRFAGWFAIVPSPGPLKVGFYHVVSFRLTQVPLASGLRFGDGFPITWSRVSLVL